MTDEQDQSKSNPNETFAIDIFEKAGAEMFHTHRSEIEVIQNLHADQLVKLTGCCLQLADEIKRMKVDINILKHQFKKQTEDQKTGVKNGNDD